MSNILLQPGATLRDALLATRQHYADGAERMRGFRWHFGDTSKLVEGHEATVATIDRYLVDLDGSSLATRLGEAILAAGLELAHVERVLDPQGITDEAVRATDRALDAIERVLREETERC